jgi:hypothetical protein
MLDKTGPQAGGLNHLGREGQRRSRSRRIVVGSCSFLKNIHAGTL